MKTVLIVSGGGFQGLTLIRALQQRNDVRLIICDIHSENPTRYLCLDYRIAPTIANAEAFSSFLLGTVKNDRVDVVFPATAWELTSLSQLKGKIEALGARVAVSNENLLSILLDKVKTYEWLREIGLPVPDTFVPINFEFDTPLFGRLRHGWGGRSTIILQDASELQKHADQWDTHVWTRWLPDFREFSLDFAIASNGSISSISMRERLRTSGGFAVISESATDTFLLELAGRIALAIARAGGCGLFNVQIMAPLQGECFISDVNPRSGTSATHALGEGINLPSFFIDSLLDPFADNTQAKRKKVRTIRILQDVSLPRFSTAPKGVIFDLDDTLIDHKMWVFRKTEALYMDHFASYVDRSEYLLCSARLIDEGVRSDLIDRLLHELSLPLTLRDNVIHAYREAVVVETPLFLDVEQTLRALKAQGFLIAVITDNPPTTQRSKITHARALDCLDAKIYTREHGGEKPRKEGFMQAAYSLSLKPGELVMVGDNYFRDGLGAVQAGYMHALIVKRNGAFLNHHDGLTTQIEARMHERIDFVDSLLSVYHTCVPS